MTRAAARFLFPTLLAVVHARPVQADDHAAKVSNFVLWARAAKDDKHRRGGPVNALMFNKCIEAYEAAIKAGVAPTDPTRVKDLPGTLEEIRKDVCDAGKADFETRNDQRSAPFLKVLKNDKLSLWRKYASSLLLANGGDAGNPDKLAAATAWFVDLSPPRVCPNGAQAHTLRSYRFDRDQKLTKTSEEEFCGRPPSSALRE